MQETSAGLSNFYEDSISITPAMYNMLRDENPAQLYPGETFVPGQITRNDDRHFAASGMLVREVPTADEEPVTETRGASLVVDVPNALYRAISRLRGRDSAPMRAYVTVVTGPASNRPLGLGIGASSEETSRAFMGSEARRFRQD